jgi:putative transposase
MRVFQSDARVGSMKRPRFTQDQIIAILKEREAGAHTADLCKRYGMSEATFYNWKGKYRTVESSDLLRLKGLEEENAKLKKLLADAMLDNEKLKDILGTRKP